MANPRVKMKAELEEKYRLKYEKKLQQAIAELEEEYKAKLAEAEANAK